MSETGRARAAVTALAAILAITASWWALALWPVGAERQGGSFARARCASDRRRIRCRTRLAGCCSSVSRPAWSILLVTIWGAELRAGLALAMARAAGQLAVGVGLALVVAGLGAVVVRVHTANAEPFATGTMDDRRATDAGERCRASPLAHRSVRTGGLAGVVSRTAGDRHVRLCALPDRVPADRGGRAGGAPPHRTASRRPCSSSHWTRGGIRPAAWRRSRRHGVSTRDAHVLSGPPDAVERTSERLACAARAQPEDR